MAARWSSQRTTGGSIWARLLKAGTARWRLRGRGDRAAGLVEYGLLVGLLAVGAMGSVDAFNEGASAAMEESVTEVGVPVAPIVPPEGGAGEGEGGSGSGSGGGPAATTSTVPTTTTLPSTSSTSTSTSTTSTTAAPTTTSTTAAPPRPEPVPEDSIRAGSSSADIYWWTGNHGQWVAGLQLTNEWQRHAYLTIEVTRVWGDGDRDRQTVNGFYVPAGGAADLDVWSNDLKDNGAKKDDVVAVELRVVHVRTSTPDWEPVSFDVEGPFKRVAAPPFP